MDWQLLANIATVIAALAVPLAGFGLWGELKRAAAGQAARVVSWTVRPYDRTSFAGLRGVVIINESEQVVRDIALDIAISPDGRLSASYPVIPPGAHFLALQEVTETTGGQGEEISPAQWSGETDQFLLLPVRREDGALRIDLRHASDESSDPHPYELLPWAESQADEVFTASQFDYSLGNARWRRGEDSRIRRVRRTAPAVRDSAAVRRFPELALSPAQAEGAAKETEASYLASASLIEAVAQRLAGGVSPDGTSPVIDRRLREAGITGVRRSRESVRAGGIRRGGLALEFLRTGADGVSRATHTFGASQYGDAPSWFSRKTGPGEEALSFKRHAPFKTRRKVDDWDPDGCDLSAAIVDAIVTDISRTTPTSVHR